MPFSTSRTNTRPSSNIPLRNLAESSGSASRHNQDESTSFLGAHHSGHRADKPGSDSDDDTESWVSTGDIGEQIDAEDPLRARLNNTLDESALAGLKHLPRNHAHSNSGATSSRREKKHVRILEDPDHHRRSHRHSSGQAGVVNKEAIEIPEPISRKPSRAARLISAIMPSSKGFTGKPLM